MSNRTFRVWIGFDPREASAFATAKESIRFYNAHVPVKGLVLSDLRLRGFYYRETQQRLGRLWDVISDAPMSTEFAISRFLIPAMERKLNPHGIGVAWAIFMDCDVLVRANLTTLIDQLDPSKALYCVKHKHVPSVDVKMDDQAQTTYARKNWSSVMVFNLGHPANKVLDVEMVNTLPGRDLHRMCWLDDGDIGELGPEWNYLVGYTKLPPDVKPKIVHFTEGGPWLNAFKDVEFADEWRYYLERWAA